MRKLVIVAVVVLGVLAWALHARAMTQTVTGQVVDLYCYDVETKANAGMDHTQGRNCAYACARWEGQPVGILTSDGKLYQLAGGLVANSNIKIVPYMAETVTISGEVSEKDGMTMLTSDVVTPAK
jgi:hypothetical protein